MFWTVRRKPKLVTCLLIVMTLTATGLGPRHPCGCVLCYSLPV